jgi:hypothetical protein
MTMQDLIQKLRARPQTVDEHLEEQKREWKRALEALFGDIEKWLAPAVTAGVLKTSLSQTEITEQDLGEYQVPVLRITDGRLTVQLEPVGGRVVSIAAGSGRHRGLRGRVDLICGATRIPLGRDASNTWKALPLRGEPRALTEESFAEILSEVLLDE